MEAGYRKQSQRVPINKNVKDEPTPETEEEPNTLQVIVLPLQTRESGQVSICSCYSLLSVSPPLLLSASPPPRLSAFLVKSNRVLGGEG